MKVKELLNLYSGSYDDAGVEINYETYDAACHDDQIVRYYYPDYDVTIHDGVILIKSKIVIVTE